MKIHLDVFIEYKIKKKDCILEVFVAFFVLNAPFYMFYSYPTDYLYIHFSIFCVNKGRIFDFSPMIVNN